jgi:hypothetical protein
MVSSFWGVASGWSFGLGIVVVRWEDRLVFVAVLHVWDSVGVCGAVCLSCLLGELVPKSRSKSALYSKRFRARLLPAM